jgi:hypothetical protein
MSCLIPLEIAKFVGLCSQTETRGTVSQKTEAVHSKTLSQKNKKSKRKKEKYLGTY